MILKLTKIALFLTLAFSVNTVNANDDKKTVFLPVVKSENSQIIIDKNVMQIIAMKGDSVYSICDGTVVFRDKTDVTIEHQCGSETLTATYKGLNSTVVENQTIKAADQIGQFKKNEIFVSLSVNNDIFATNIFDNYSFQEVYQSKTVKTSKAAQIRQPDLWLDTAGGFDRTWQSYKAGTYYQTIKVPYGISNADVTKDFGIQINVRYCKKSSRYSCNGWSSNFTKRIYASSYSPIRASNWLNENVSVNIPYLPSGYKASDLVLEIAVQIFGGNDSSKSNNLVQYITSVK